MYHRGDKYLTKSGRTYFFIYHPGFPDGKFSRAIETYCNALINSNGGMLVFGVDGSEQVAGFELSRAEEDSYKCHFDAAIRQMKPTIHPHQYRFDVIYLGYCPLALFEIRISAGEPEEIYENSRREMFIVREKKLYGPLFPCEITQIVLEKYKEELSTLMENRHTSTSQSESSQAQNEDEIETTATNKKIKIAKISWP